MAIKYLAGERLQGTAAERAAMTTHASLNYSAILGSPYSPNFFLKLNEGTGTAVANSGSDSGLTASISASSTSGVWADGVTGNSKSIKIVGSGTSVGITHSGLQSGWTDNYTMGITFKMPANFTGGDSNHHHMWFDNHSGIGMWQMNITNNGYVGTGYYVSSWEHTVGDTDAADDAWHTFFVTQDSSRNIKGYLDGEEEFSQSSAGSSGYAPNDADLLGHNGGASTDIIYYDNAFMKESVLSASDISNLHDLLIPSSTTSTYPNLTNGTLFEESDTGKIYIFDGTNTWNEMT